MKQVVLRTFINIYVRKSTDKLKPKQVDVLPSKNQMSYKVNYCESTTIVTYDYKLMPCK